MTPRTETIARNRRWNEIQVWIDRANALGLSDVADNLFIERMDLVLSEDETRAHLERARAACLLHAFHTDED